MLLGCEVFHTMKPRSAFIWFFVSSHQYPFGISSKNIGYLNFFLTEFGVCENLHVNQSVKIHLLKQQVWLENLLGNQPDFDKNLTLPANNKSLNKSQHHSLIANK